MASADERLAVSSIRATRDRPRPRHRVVRQATGPAGAEHWDDVGCCRPAASRISRWNRSALEAVREIRRQDLQHDPATEPMLLREEHPTHAATAQLAFEQVAVGQGGPEVIGEVRQAEDSRGIRCRLLRWSAGGQ